MSTEKHIELWRIRETGVSNLGYLHLKNGDADYAWMVTIEPTELFNLPEISCIKEGEYWVNHHESPTFGKCLKVKDVEGRTNVLCHAGNFFNNTKACILPGLTFGYANKDAQIDVIESKKGLAKLMMFVPDEGCKLTIRKVDNFQTVFNRI